ncbi:MAG: hypothetical protein IPJ74_19275 [Saprospiraceae bacterium]|nr:hypothetical protein [Saprospiraceae bacterium]
MQFKQILISGILIAMIASLSACYYDSEEFLYGVTTQECDTITVVTYSAHVSSILQKNCYACHSQGSNLGNLLLDSYTTARNAANNGSMMGSVNHKAGYSPMPQGAPKLSSCDIQSLQAWLDDGTPNN